MLVQGALTSIDWIVLTLYLVGMVGLSVWVGRGQTSQADYYVGGRNLPWWAIGISTMATQTSVISFISIPAFVALKQGGGLSWMQYELAVPLAMVFVMVVLLPLFRRLELISVYEYLELRFSRRVRRSVSAVFLLNRGLSTGIGVYASAVVLSVVTGIDWRLLVIVVGVITIIYDTIGGMSAVVWSDVVQMVVLIVGLVLCIVLAVDSAGGAQAVLDGVPADRFEAINFEGGFAGEETPFWAFVIGGFFLYCSYYGTDQSQTQRALSSPSVADTRRSLILNGLARFPLTCAYLLLGVALAGALANDPAWSQTMQGRRIDDLVPLFVVSELPIVVRGIVIAAMLAAAMSSLDSALNSLSAATMRDFLEREGKQMAPRRMLVLGRLTTVAWGVVVTALALVADKLASSIVVAINKVGSAFYGPLLAVFVIGILSRRATGTSAIAGLVAGVGLNIGLWLGASDLHWMWWNATGFAATAGTAYSLGTGTTGLAKGVVLDAAAIRTAERPWLTVHAGLVAYFVLILAAGVVITRLVS